MKDDVLISIFSLLQKQLFREWGTWIYEVGFLISEKDLRRMPSVLVLYHTSVEYSFHEGSILSLLLSVSRTVGIS